MIIGFTGSSKTTTEEQATELRRLIQELKPSEAHHDDCIEADALFHSVCLKMQVPVNIGCQIHLEMMTL